MGQHMLEYCTSVEDKYRWGQRYSSGSLVLCVCAGVENDAVPIRPT